MSMVPNIRIEGYTGDWKDYAMSDVITGLYNGQTPYRGEPSFWNGNINWLSSGDLNRGIVMHSTEKITELGLKNAHLRIVPKGTFVMAITGLEAAGTRGNCGMLGIDTAMNQSCMAIFPEKKLLDANFLFQWYQAHSESMGIRLTQGTKQQSYNAEIIKRINISIPSLCEQQAIADFLKSLDITIFSTTKKIAKLEQTKKACLQSMFPQEGECVPKVRFKGFEGEWEVVKLDDCLAISTERNSGNIYGKDEVLSVSDDFGVVNQISLLGRSYAGKSVENYKVLRTNQIVYTKSPLKSKPYGIVKVNKGETGIVSVLYAVYDAKEGVCPDYIHFYFQSKHRVNNYLLPLINKGAKNTMNISDETALEGLISIPSQKEQKMIADYLWSLEKMISLQSRRLSLLKHIKSACLDNMFV